MQCARVLLVLSVVGCSPGAALRAQDSIPWPAGNRLRAVVHATTTMGTLDTVHVTYTVGNDPSSEQRIEFLMVRTSGQVVSVHGPMGWYANYALIGDSAVASWSSMLRRTEVAGGGTLGGFTLTGIGWLDIVGYRAQGDYDIPAVSEDSADLIQHPPSVWANAFAGVTLGIVPAVPSASAADQLARLVDRTRQSCELQWIPHSETCASLTAKLDAASRDLARDRATAAAGSIRAFLSELHALPASQASEEARALLGSAAERILEVLGRR